MRDSTRVLVLGAAGQLGRQVVARLRAGSDYDVAGCDLPELDITDRDETQAFVTAARPDWLVNCAAMTDLERCRREPGSAMRINADAVAILADACNAAGATLVQISTDYIFDGTLRRPYREDDPAGPLSVYARSKWLSEQNARSCNRFLIVRTAWLYGPKGVNFIAKILKRAETGAALRVVDDQIGNPSFAPDVADGMERLMRTDARGVFHVVNEGETSWYELACRVIDLAGLDVAIEAVSTEAFGSPIPRPRYSVLDTTKYVQTTGHRLRHWSDALGEFIRNRGWE